MNKKYAGGWKSDEVVESYGVRAEGEKRRTDHSFAQDTAFDRILPGNKKVTAITPTETTETLEPKWYQQVTRKRIKKVVSLGSVTAVTKRRYRIPIPVPNSIESVDTYQRTGGEEPDYVSSSMWDFCGAEWL